MHRCPVCDRDFEPELEPEYDLPPTGGDFEFCQGRQEICCARCGAKLIASVRTWLDARGTECLGLTQAPPDPHPFCSAVELRLAPHGRAVAVRSLGGEPWLLVDTDQGPVAQSLPGEGWVKGWSVDGDRVFTEKSGDILSLASGESIGRIPWPFVRDWDSEPTRNPTGRRFAANIRSAGFVGDAALAIDTAAALEDHATHLDVVAFADGTPHGLLTHRGSGNMDGAGFFAPNGERFLHVRAARHGDAEFFLRLYRLSPDRAPELIVEAEHRFLSIEQVVWEEAGSLLVVYDPRCRGAVHTKMPYGLARLDGDSLAVGAHTQQVELPPRPSDKDPLFWWPPDVRAVAMEPDGSILLATDAIYRVRERDNGFVCASRFEIAGGPMTAAALNGPEGQAFFAADEEIYLCDLQTGDVAPVGRSATAALSPPKS